MLANEKDTLSRIHWLLSTIASMGVFLDGYDLSVISFSVILIAQTFKFTERSNPLIYGLVLSSALIGMALGGFSFGYFSDKVGRKAVFAIDLVFFIVFAGLSSLATSVYWLIVARLLMGVGIGADYPISSSLISELSPAKKRGMLLMFGIMFYWLGTMLAGIVNYFSLSLGASLSWRVALAAGALIAVPVVIARGYMPESARWLYAKHKNKEAEKVEKKLSIRVGKQSDYETRELFGKYARQFAFVAIAWFSFDIGSYGLGFYTSTLYKAYGISNLHAIALFTVLTAPFPIFSYVLLMRMLDKKGRKTPSIMGFAVMAVVLLLVGPLIKLNAYLLLPLFIIFAFFEQWPGGILSFAYSVELFPTSIRGFSQGLATSISRIGALLGVLLFPVIAVLGLFYATCFFAAFVILALMVTALLAPETKSKTLEELSG